jgi:hypothetical protein
MRALRYEISLVEPNTGRQKRVEVEVLPEEHDAAMQTDDPELFLRAYALKRMCQMRPLGTYRPVLPDGMRRIEVH